MLTRPAEIADGKACREINRRTSIPAPEHTTQDGEPRLLEHCRVPLTAVGVGKLVATDLDLFESTPGAFCLRDHAPEWTPQESQAQSMAQLSMAADLQVFRLRQAS